MEQIGSAARNLEWKESCDDISSVRHADVFPAVDYWAPEAGLHRHFHFESSVWLDRDRLGGRLGLGVRERRTAAGVCDGWSGAVLRPVRSDDRGRSFLPKLRAAALGRTTGRFRSKAERSAVTRVANKSTSEMQPPCDLQFLLFRVPHPFPGAGAPSFAFLSKGWEIPWCRQRSSHQAEFGAVATNKFLSKLRKPVVNPGIRKTLAALRLPIFFPAMRDCGGVC